jgi:hypothetical protein
MKSNTICKLFVVGCIILTSGQPKTASKQEPQEISSTTVMNKNYRV